MYINAASQLHFCGFQTCLKVQQCQIEETNVVEELTHKISRDPPLRPAVITHILPLWHTGCFLNLVFQVRNKTSFFLFMGQKKIHLEGREEGSGLMTGVNSRKEYDSEGKTDMMDETTGWEWWSDNWERTVEQEEQGNKVRKVIMQVSKPI